MVHPGYYGLAATFAALVFSAGGFFAGTKMTGDTTKKDIGRLDDEVKNLDTVKMSRSVCTERHNHISQTLDRIENKVDQVLENGK
jgi:hypothetical protein